jgi:hypothetical protein
MSKTKNPIILRLGIKNNWDSKYFEKKQQESATYSLQHLEINKFVTLFFKKHGLESKNCKLYYKKNSLHLFIVYNVNALKIKALLFNKTKKLRIKNCKIKNLRYNLFNKNYTKKHSPAQVFDVTRIKKKFTNKINFKILKSYLTTREKNYKIYKNCLRLRMYLDKKIAFKNPPSNIQRKKT